MQAHAANAGQAQVRARFVKFVRAQALGSRFATKFPVVRRELLSSHVKSSAMLHKGDVALARYGLTVLQIKLERVPVKATTGCVHCRQYVLKAETSSLIKTHARGCKLASTSLPMQSVSHWDPGVRLQCCCMLC